MSMAAKVHRRLHRSLVFDRRRNRLVDALLAQLPAGSRILDIGCGSGEISAALAAAGHDVVGVETLARDDCAIELTMFDGLTLPFADDSFEWAIVIDVLHHAADPARVVGEARRVARRGIVVKDHYAESRWQRFVLSAMDWVGNRQFGVGRDGRYLSRHEWSELWSQAQLAQRETNEAIDLYPTIVKPLFERNLHFVTRLERV